MSEKSSYQLLSFYKFVNVAHASQKVAAHKSFCQDIGLKGRIYIGPEGISATVSGNTGQLWAYRQYLDQDQDFGDITDIDSKATAVDGHCFDKMVVKYRDEIVALGKVYDAKQIADGGQRMSIDEFKQIIDSHNDDYVILDMRNSYEYKLGHFKGAIPAGTINFRELDQFVDLYKEKFGKKKVVTYCTGGIRCEKATVMMREFGLDQVYQLDGGVVKYVNSFNDGNWQGNLYTFDGRVSTEVGDKKTHTPIGRCIYTQCETNNCENCRYSECNARILATKKEYKRHLGFCSQECMESAKQTLLVKGETFDPVDYRELRSLVKLGKISHADALGKVSKHFDFRLTSVNFNHQTSQKEELIDKQLLEKSYLTLSSLSS